MKSFIKSMFKYSLLLLLVSPSMFAIESQIFGKLLDISNNKPIIGSAIQLIDASDSSHIAMTFADSLGHFSISSNDMNHQLIWIFSCGYRDTIIPLENYVAKSISINLGDILLETRESTQENQ